MYKSLLCLMTLCAITTNYAQAQSYQLAKNGSVGFYIKKFAIKVLQAEFEQVDSHIDFDATRLSQSHMSFVMKVDSLKLSNDALHDMVLGPDVFNVQQYKDIIFESTEIQNIGEHDYHVLGHLTIKGKTKPVVFDTQIIPTTQNNRFIFKANTQIQSHNFAMKSKFGSLTDQVNIFVDGELIAK
ncbi:YceI family protein [Acinetobacter sp. B5B]|uniref:YceI family protein n=1 Tax=Acinetobacter baretiae TaxID=2605383 RepID=UPI0018C32C83|nr:YceI family protein [Acinetobacter baretiae]MBF7682698.1 YceI family protein [Acinetobacter baretiae]